MDDAPDKIWAYAGSFKMWRDHKTSTPHAQTQYTRSDMVAHAALVVADRMLELEAEVARLRETLVLITGAYDPKDYGGNSEVMFSIAGAALQSHGEAYQ
jgi:hypothetical protein